MGEANRAAPLEAPRSLDEQIIEGIVVPEPKMLRGKLQCPICSQQFTTKRDYQDHVKEDHKTGTSISTAIY